MSYEVIGNQVLRDGKVAAVVLPDGYLDTPEGMEKYRTQCVKELAKVGRRNENGTFVFVDEATAAKEAAEAEDVPENTPETVPAVYKFPTISTVRELVRAVEAATGETAPALSPLWGDETPEVWAWLRRHIDAYNTIRTNHRIALIRNHLEE